MSNKSSIYNRAATKLLQRNLLDCINRDYLDVPDANDMVYITVTSPDRDGFITLTTEYPEDNEVIVGTLAEFASCPSEGLSEAAEVIGKNESGVITYRLPDKCLSEPESNFCGLALRRAKHFISLARLYDGDRSGRDEEFALVLEEVDTLSKSFSKAKTDSAETVQE